MYVKIDGQMRLNSSELILDMYTYMNSDKCGGKLFEFSDTGELSVIDTDTKKQKFLFS